MDIIRLEGVTKIYKSHSYSSKGNEIKALDSIDLSIRDGEPISLVGESGAGKTTLLKVILGLTPPTEGKILFKGVDISKRRPREVRRKMGYIPQHPEDAFDPRWRIMDSILEPLKQVKKVGMDEIEDLLSRLALNRKILDRRPHEVSGGELQRAVIASALSTNPEFLACDEPTSMLDVSTQAEILRLLKSLQREMGFSCIFVSHDIRIAKFMGKLIYVMLAGRIVEVASSDEIVKNPLHPYTKALLGSIDVPYITNGRMEGCPFFDRCPFRTDRCKRAPSLREVEVNHYVACHLY